MPLSRRHHPFVPAGPGDRRSPCPALNALANHSYIPHSGRSIPFLKLVYALRMVYNCSYPLAFLLTIVGFLWCGHRTGRGIFTRISLDLHDLARHNRVEHDGSLGHADAASGEEYAPTFPDPARISSLLDAGRANTKGPGGVGALTFFDLVRVRYQRDTELVQPLDPVHAFITRGEIALMLLALGVGCSGDSEEFAIPRERVKQWFVDERLPDGWDGPRKQIGLLNTGNVGQRVKSEVNRLARYG